MEISFNEENGINSSIKLCKQIQYQDSIVLQCNTETFYITVHDSVLSFTNTFGTMESSEYITKDFWCEGTIYRIFKYKLNSDRVDKQKMLFYSPSIGIIAYYNQGWIYNFEIIFDSLTNCSQAILSLIKSDLEFYFEYTNWPEPPEIEAY